MMDLIPLVPMIVLSLAAYRLTRFLVIDSLIAGSRNKFHSFVINKAQKENKILHLCWEKVFDLSSCTWCLGFHVSWVLLAIYLQTYPWDLGFKGWISAFAIAGIQGLLHAWEPNDEE